MGSSGDVGEKDVKAGNMFGINEGGRSIFYHEEDPHIRTYFQTRLNAVGVDFTMPEETFAGQSQRAEQRRGGQLTAMLAARADLVSNVTLARIADTEANVAAQVDLSMALAAHLAAGPI